MTKEEANEVWHQLMEESEVPPSLRGSEKIRTQMDENVTAAVTDRRQLVLPYSEKIRERRLALPAHYVSAVVSAVTEGESKLPRSFKIIKLKPKNSYKVELHELSSAGDEVKLVEFAPELKEIVGANCYDTKKNVMGKNMRIEYFRKEGSHLKLIGMRLDFDSEQECEDAQLAIVEALADQEKLDCVPGGEFIKGFSNQGSRKFLRPLFCSNWCKEAFEPFDLNLKTDFGTAEGAAMFWSTGTGRRDKIDNMQDAQKFAMNHTYMTLEQTKGGDILNKATLFGAEKHPSYFDPVKKGLEVDINNKKVWISSLNHAAYLWNCASMELAIATGEKRYKSDKAGGKTYPIHIYAEKANAVSPFALLNTVPTWYNIELPSMIGAYLAALSADTKQKTEFASANILLKNKVDLTYHWKDGGEVHNERRIDQSLPSFSAREVLEVFYAYGKAYPGYGEDEGIEETKFSQSMAKGGDKCTPFSTFGSKACAPGLKCVNTNRLSIDENGYECSSGESRASNTKFDPCVYDSDCSNGYACYWKDGLDKDGAIYKDPTNPIGAVCQIINGVAPSRKRDLCYSPAGRCTSCGIMQKEFKKILEGCKCDTGKIDWVKPTMGISEDKKDAVQKRQEAAAKKHKERIKKGKKGH